MLWDIVRKGKYFPIIPDSTLMITWQQRYDQPNKLSDEIIMTYKRSKTEHNMKLFVQKLVLVQHLLPRPAALSAYLSHVEVMAGVVRVVTL